MDYDQIDADSFGRSLRGLGPNLLVRDVRAEVTFLRDVFGFTAHQPTTDFAIIRLGETVLQLHSDATYRANSLLSLLPENPPRGAGLEIRLYDIDPDQAVAKANARGDMILQPPTDKPHGLREAYILCENGYAWVPSRPKDKD
jgi:catechol 2,3-dioxygenase-like lactoylglutathione lyase family enzyme